MMERIAKASLRLKARMAGFSYLLTGTVYGVGQIFVLASLLYMAMQRCPGLASGFAALMFVSFASRSLSHSTCAGKHRISSP
jgi:hypothetical protein